jgi:hypothetical protein
MIQGYKVIIFFECQELLLGSKLSLVVADCVFDKGQEVDCVLLLEATVPTSYLQKV